MKTMTNRISFFSTMLVAFAAAAFPGCVVDDTKPVTQADVDPCAVLPCLHDGVCVPAGDDFACICAAGFTGATCDTDIDDCDPNPCFNSGVCTDETNGYTCTCPTGFSGAQCETNIDDCSASPCANGGICIDRVDGYDCICAAGFTGATCETDIDDCNPNPCFHGGVCTDAVNGFTCACSPGYWGTQCEDAADALVVTTPAPLMVAAVGHFYSVQMSRTGGTSAAQWSIRPGGANNAWLTLNSSTGLLQGTPTDADLGPVSLTVRVEEPFHPDNFADMTFTFEVITPPPPSYDMTFAGVCPNDWTLTGDWQCGVPQNVGPATAHSDTQCLGTQIAGNYNNLRTFAGTTATSPDIPLAAFPQELTFWAWVDTEGATYDGFNLQISADSGASFSVVNTVTPGYPLTIAGMPAWGGHQAAAGWVRYKADLTAYSGQTVRIRFAFQSDSSGVFPGVYIDDVHIEYPE